MSIRTPFVLLIALGFSSACLPVSAPTPLPLPTSSPSPTVMEPVPVGLLPTPTNDRFAPANVPACEDAEYLQQPVEFAWSGIDDIVRDAPATNWTYYHCDQSPATLAAFYRQWMVKAPFTWIETFWEERHNATLGAYYHKDPDRWLYLWFVSKADDREVSNLVAAWWNVQHSC